jgi:acetyl-CoA carboxylase carboxyl transferase subunit beta
VALFRRKKKYIEINSIASNELKKRRALIPDGLAESCPHCREIIFRNSISEENLCPKCGYHLQFPALERVEWLADEGSFEEWSGDLKANDPFDFPSYKEKIKISQKRTQLEEAVLTGEATLNGLPFALGVMDNRFIMASMGTVVGEKIAQLFERATDKQLPVILYVASGGARMQEGILSLMQMAKISQAVSKHSQAGLFYAPILTHPTTGGVTASFAMQGDIILAEPGATIGFAGKRVIQQTITSELPDDFQTAEATLKNGFIDRIVPRKEQHSELYLLLFIHQQKG